MVDIGSIRKFFGVILAIILCFNIISTAASPVDMNNMDYEQLMSLLGEQEGDLDTFQEYSDLEQTPAETNNIPQYYSAQKNLNIQSSYNPLKTPQNKRVSASASASASGSASSGNIDFTFTKPSASTILSPHVEILHIVESFLRLKGEMATRIHALINDNFDLFQSIYNVIVAKASKLHGFTLFGISVIRKILEFAVQMIGTWEVNAPSVSIGVNKVFNAMG